MQKLTELKNKFQDLTGKIDPFFAQVYKPLVENAEGAWLDFLNSLKPGFFRTACINIGVLIPSKCYFKEQFNLNFTPCSLNPFYMHLVELAIWARTNADKKLYPFFYDILSEDKDDQN